MKEVQIITFEAVLATKEKRAQLQSELRERHGATVVSVTVNMPGQVKYSAETQNLLYYAMQVLRERFREQQFPLHEERVLHLPAGPTILMAVTGDAAKIKEIGMAIEQATKFGRLLDIDVFDNDGRQINRAGAGYTARPCFVCSGPAVKCIRERKHDFEEIQAAVNRLMLEYRAASTASWPPPVKQIGDAALEAMLMEVACTPSPGLVDRVNSGAHMDMDFFTFLQSSSAINVGIYRCALAGWQHEGEPADLLPLLRRIGVDAERDMTAATAGVNTQKGLIFLLGIIAAASAMLLKQHPDKFDSGAVLTMAAAICRGIVEREMACLKYKDPGRKLTAGERLYLAYGVAGIRGEIENGLTVVSQKGLPLLKEALAAGLSLNDALVHALLGLMTVTEDTTILNRHDLDILAEVQGVAKQILAVGGMLTEQGRAHIHDLDAMYSNQRNISPGGSADLLAVTYFLYKIEAGMSGNCETGKK